MGSLLSGFDAAVMPGGHTHAQMLRRHRDLTLINPGSVGLPIEWAAPGRAARRPPWAEYAFVSWERGRLGIELRRVPLDLDAVKRAAFESGMPNPEWWVKDWH